MNSSNRHDSGGNSRWRPEITLPPRPATSTVLVLALFILSVFAVSCGSGEDLPPARPPVEPVGTTPGGPNEGSEPPVSPDIPDTPGPTDTPTPAPPLFAGYDLEFSEGDFWRFRWELLDRSCAQGSGCKTTEDDGVFQVTLGPPKEWKGATVFSVSTSGRSEYVDDGITRSFELNWRYIGVKDDRIVATDASGDSPLVTLFDARTGKWPGSGFFTDRFSSDELIEASPGQLTDSNEFASWEGVQTGPWHFVKAADSGGECSTFDGRILCPSEEKFDYTETEYYRPGIGPFAYMFNYAATFSGGGFTTSFQTVERVALIASSFTGDDPGDFGKPTPTPEPTPTATPVVLAEPIFGPIDGSLWLDPRSTDIPEFGADVNISRGVADVTFENPDVAGGRWSHGIMFRNSAEESFHTVFITGDGEWGHFARSGSLDSEVVLATGQFDFDKAVGAQNRLTVWFGVLDGKSEGVFLINGQEVAGLDLSFAGASLPGDVSVLSGIFPSDEFTGAITHFTGFTVFDSP